MTGIFSTTNGTWKECYNHSLTIEYPEEFFPSERNMIVYERGLNIAGYLPIVSNFSAVARALIGGLEILDGQVRFISKASSVVSSCLQGQRDIARRSSEEALNALKLSAHGIANINRSMVEVVPVLGNMASFLYDHCDLRLKYRKEKCCAASTDLISHTKKILKIDGIECFVEKPEGKGPFPVLFMIHGNQPSKTSVGGIEFDDFGYLSLISKKGIVAVSISLPGFGKSQGKRDFFGPQAQDGILTVLNHFKELEFVDNTKMGIYGVSGGAITASMVSVRYEGLCLQILQSGIYDLENWHIHKCFQLAREQFLKQAEGNAIDRSVVAQIDTITSPTLILHGELDAVGGLDSARKLHEGLLKNHISSRLIIYPTLTHYLKEQSFTHVLAFLEENFFNKHGIGIKLTPSNPYPQIASFVIGYPAEKCEKLHLGDVILAVSANDDQSMVDIASMPISQIDKLVKGEPGSQLRLKVVHLDETEEEVVVARSL